jgi:hypothetical protein
MSIFLCIYAIKQSGKITTVAKGIWWSPTVMGINSSRNNRVPFDDFGTTENDNELTRIKTKCPRVENADNVDKKAKARTEKNNRRGKTGKTQTIS